MSRNTSHRYVTDVQFSSVRIVVPLSTNEFQGQLLLRKHIFLEYLGKFWIFVIYHFLFIINAQQVLVPVRKRKTEQNMTAWPPRTMTVSIKSETSLISSAVTRSWSEFSISVSQHLFYFGSVRIISTDSMSSSSVDSWCTSTVLSKAAV